MALIPVNGPELASGRLPQVKRTICVATATRAEYGLLKWLMHEIREAAALSLQCLVSGAHLSPAHGLTYREIERDGFTIDARVEMLLSSDGDLSTTKSMALCLIGVG
jgi:GDP/UDP-N,N'-diacetylbacillosamine 2-epimerase (hydrolysing)